MDLSCTYIRKFRWSFSYPKARKLKGTLLKCELICTCVPCLDFKDSPFRFSLQIYNDLHRFTRFGYGFTQIFTTFTSIATRLFCELCPQISVELCSHSLKRLCWWRCWQWQRSVSGHFENLWSSCQPPSFYTLLNHISLNDSILTKGTVL